MADGVRLACHAEVVLIPLDKILPTRSIGEAVQATPKYKCIEASVREVGVIEPLVVFPQSQSDGCYILLDGHVRYRILKSLAVDTAKCLVASDDEGFTYNHKVNRLNAIQEHFMILRAIKNGVSEDRIARTLNVDVASIRQKRDLLEGICVEAVQLLKHRRPSAGALRELRKVKPIRQIEIAELMCAAGNFTVGYAKCLVGASPDDQLIDGDRAKLFRGLSVDDLARMEHETESLHREFKLIEESHGKNVLNLVLVVGYLKRCLENVQVARYLSQHHPEILAEFQKLVDSRTLHEEVEDQMVIERNDTMTPSGE